MNRAADRRRRGRTPLPVAAGIAGWAIPLGLLCAPPAAAQVEVTIDPARTSVAVGEPLRVDVHVISEAGSPEAIGTLPANGFAVLGTSQSQAMEFSFGMGRNVQRVRVTQSYTLQPQAPGTFTLGPVQVRLGGRTYSSDTVRVLVRPGSGGTAAPVQPVPGWSALAPTPPPPPAEGTTEEEVPLSACRRPDGSALPATGADGPATCTVVRPGLFLQLDVTDLQVYLGEPLRMQIRAFVERSEVGFSVGALFSQLIRQEPSLEGFLRTNLERRQLDLDTRSIQGRTYLWTTLRDKLLYPTREGRLTIGAAEAELSVPDLFRPRSLRRRTAALPITVLPLPAEGRPAGFSPNNVAASLAVEARASPTAVRVGESFEVTLMLRGEGNLAGFRIDPPDLRGATVLKASDRVVEPTADDLLARRTVTFLVTPSQPGEIDLADFGLSYFDYEARQYRTARAGALRVAVTPGEAPAAATAAGGEDPGTAAAPTTSPTASIRPRDDLARPPAPWHASLLFWALLLAPPVSLAGAHAWSAAARALRRRRGQVRPADVFRRSLKTLRRVARGRSGDDPAAQLAAVETALLDYLEARAGEPLRGYATADLRRRLVAAGFAEPLVDRLVAQLDSCAFGRFAPSASRERGASETARAAETVLRELERAPATPPGGKTP